MPVGIIAAAGLGLAGSAMQASAAKKAASAQADAATQSVQFQRDAATQARFDAYPWALAGAQSLYKYMDEIGVPRPQTPILPDLTAGPFGYNPTQTTTTTQQNQSPINLIYPGLSRSAQETGGGQQTMIGQQGPPPGVTTTTTAPNAIPSPSQIPMTASKGFTETPGYQFRVQQGEQGVLNNLSAMGMKNSGKALKSLETFRQGLASEEYNTYLNRLASMAGMGQTQTNQTNALTQNAATNIGQAYQDRGAATASGYMGAANAWSNGLNTLGGALGQWSKF